MAYGDLEELNPMIRKISSIANEFLDLLKRERFSSFQINAIGVVLVAYLVRREEEM